MSVATEQLLLKRYREAKLLESPLLVVVVPVKLDKAVDILDTSDAIVEA